MYGKYDMIFTLGSRINISLKKNFIIASIFEHFPTPIIKVQQAKARPKHREICALLFSIIVIFNFQVKLYIFPSRNCSAIPH